MEIKESKARVTIAVDSSDKSWDAVDYFYPKKGDINKISVKWLVQLKGDAEKLAHALQEAVGKKEEW